jgi:hypothetical protein
VAEHRQPDDQKTTVAICLVCGKTAYKGGELPPGEKMVKKMWFWCAFGEGWSYCNTYDEYVGPLPPKLTFLTRLLNTVLRFLGLKKIDD